MSVMSAVVAFNGFPSQDIQDPIGSVPVLERQAPLAVEKHSAKPAASHVVNSSAAISRHSRRHHDGRAGSAKAPVAHANPLVHRESATPQQGTQPSGSSGAGPSPGAGPHTSPGAHHPTPQGP